MGLDNVPLYALADSVCKAEVGLCYGMPLLSGFAIPIRRFPIILRNTLAGEIHIT